MTTGKTIALTRRTSVGKVMSLLFNMLSRLVITFLPRSKCLLISWLHSPPTVISEPQKIRSATVSPSICHEVMGPDTMILVFWMVSFKPTSSLSSVTFIKRHFSASSLSALRVVPSVYNLLLIINSVQLTVTTTLWCVRTSRRNAGLYDRNGQQLPSHCPHTPHLLLCLDIRLATCFKGRLRPSPVAVASPTTCEESKSSVPESKW